MNININYPPLRVPLQKLKWIISVCLAKNGNLIILCIWIATLFFSCNLHQKDIEIIKIDEAYKLELVEKYKKQYHLDTLRLALQESIDAKDELKELMVRKYLGKLLRNNSMFLEAIEMHKTAFQLAETTCDTLEMIELQNDLGTDFRRINSLSEATEYHNRAMTFCDQFSDKTNTTLQKQYTVAMNGMGNICLTLEFYDESKRCFIRCLEIENILESNIGLAINYANLGAVYETQNQLDSALICYNISMQNNQLAQSKVGISLCYSYFGKIYQKQNKTEEAHQAFHQSYETIKDSKDVWHWLVASIALAEIELKIGAKTEGFRLLIEADKLAQKIASPEHLAITKRMLADYYQNNGNHKLAFEYLQNSINHEQLWLKELQQNKILETRITYLNNVSQKQINTLSEENLLQKEFSRKMLWIGSIIVSLLFLVMVLVLFILRYRTQRNRQLVEMNALKDKFFSIISHDLKNPVIAQRNTLELLVQNFDKIPNHIIQTQCCELSKSSESLLDLLQNLLSWSRLEARKMTIKPIRFDLKSAINEVVELMIPIINIKKQTLTVEIPDNIYTFSDLNMVSTIVRNLGGNAIKFTNEGGKINISVIEQNNKWRISVEDTGVGMSEETLKSLFALSTHQTNLGTSGEKGTGLGLLISKEMVELLGSKLNIESCLGEGTTMSFLLNKEK